MIFKIFSKKVVDSILLKTKPKYKVTKMDKEWVLCEVISSGAEARFKLKDLVSDDKLKYFSSKDILTISKVFNGSFLVDKDDTKSQDYYNILTQLYIVILIISNIAVAKISNVAGIPYSGGMLLFPMLYILNDIITEIYGFRATRRVIFRALAFNIFAIVFLYIVVLIPSHGELGTSEAYNQVFATTPRILIASILSYVFGEIFNAYIISNLKIKLKGRFLALRAIVSTFMAAAVDTSIFCAVLFFGIMPFQEIISLIFYVALAKVCYEILLIPITVYIVNYIKVRTSTDIFEVPKL